MKKDVIEAPRKVLRDIKNPLAKDFKKYLAEILLNADDSYKRLDMDDTVKTIDIILDRANKEVTVVDRAEGMSYDDLMRIFAEYGASYAGGSSHEVRGLFGQGASDVLFSSASSHKKAEIKSIKDDQFQVCKFNFNKKKQIQVTKPKTHLKQIRKKYGIENNGTIVLFGLPDEVKIPPKGKIKDALETFYMFRYIMSDPKRKVILKDGEKTTVLSSKKYTLENKKLLLEDKPVLFKYEDYEIKGTLTLYENKKKATDKTDVIITDERKAVYDNTLFGLEKFPGAQNISGVLRLKGIYAILEEKLNDPVNPLQILTDSRDGFDKRNEFTKKLNKTVGDIVEKVIRDYDSKRKNKVVSIESIKKVQDALRKFNDYYTERFASNIGALSPGANPPENGLAFARESINITEKKTYGLQIYINANLVSDKVPITIDSFDATHYAVHQKSLSFDQSDANEQGLIIKTLAIDGLEVSEDSERLTATSQTFNTDTFVKVVKQEVVYPEYGLEFIPKHYTFKPKKPSKLKLYYDYDKYPPGTKIDVTFSSKQELVPFTKPIWTDKSQVLNNQTGMIEIPFKSDLSDANYVVTAKAEGYETKARIKIKEKSKKNNGKGGFLNSIKILSDEATWQATIDEKNATLYINGSHPINTTLMGNLEALDKDKPKFTSSQLNYIFELLAHEFAREIVRRERSTLDNHDIERLYRDIQNEKTAMYKKILE
ncbi:MAG: hypothetical protein ACQEQA_04675 [Bacillota bacterium]